MIKKIPYPMSGLILSLFALGNLLANYSVSLRLTLGAFAFILYLLYTTNLFVNKDKFKEEMKNPVIAGVFGTYSMSTMILATYIKPFIPALAFLIWIAGIIIHIALILFYFKNFVSKKDIKLVFPTWFIIFVGVVVASVTGGAFQQLAISKIAFYFGLASYIVLIPIVGKRVFVFKNIPEPALATVAIFTAPGGLLLAGYISAFETKNIFILYFLITISTIFYIYSLSQIPSILKQKPMPSISAITFPTVITAIGFKMANNFLIKSELPIPYLSVIVHIMEIIAIFCVIIACYRYFVIITKK